ncbi:DUF3307 domain-containing protein [Pelagerythrobacter marinus]|uniref:DUF3307 domain-containing protein n=1 Tax=Pelagerythrobacter marinus TaxID=538382 RepID=UPI002AC8DF35|nr:DUF3307 domain-containing protein [Pelagerythrobacter marinus]WPZ05512.1 DUF3307 domain-containing protein [Pelagerythrobacter marinus]
MNDIAMMAVALVAGHALADYPLQGDFLAKAKNRDNPIPGVPWWQALAAHAAIHGGFVAAITGVWWLFFAEFAAHWLTDDAKCRGRISFNADQAIHLVCKAWWILIAVAVAF